MSVVTPKTINDTDSKNALKISEGHNVEYIVTSFGQFQPAINVNNLYGSQESKLTINQIKDEWDVVFKDIVDIESKEEHLILLTDANCHIGTALMSCPKIIPRGKLLLNLMERDEFVLVNSGAYSLVLHRIKAKSE